MSLNDLLVTQPCNTVAHVKSQAGLSLCTLAMAAEMSCRTFNGILLTGRPLTWYLRATRLMMDCSIKAERCKS